MKDNNGVSQMTKSAIASRRRSSVGQMEDHISVNKERVEKIIGPHSALGSYKVDNQRSVTPRKDFDNVSKLSQTINSIRETKGKVLDKKSIRSERISPVRAEVPVTFKEHNDAILHLHDYHANHKDNLLSAM